MLWYSLFHAVLFATVTAIESYSLKKRLTLWEEQILAMTATKSLFPSIRLNVMLWFLWSCSSRTLLPLMRSQSPSLHTCTVLFPYLPQGGSRVKNLKGKKAWHPNDACAQPVVAPMCPFPRTGDTGRCLTASKLSCAVFRSCR